MKPEEAIGMYKRFKYYLERERKTDSDHYKSNLIALEALEKQIAQKPIPDYIYDSDTDDYETRGWLCPCCVKPISKEDEHNGIYHHCAYCGTKIDWED